MFTDVRLQGQLIVRVVRRVAPWDAMNVGFERAEVDAWITAARAAGLRPLISFGHSRIEGQRRSAPTPATFVAAFRKFRVRYPDVTKFAVWMNQRLREPLCHKPQLAARYYDALRAACSSCTLLVAEVLDVPSMASWVRSFLKAVKHEPAVWGLHNYLDANRLRTKGTRTLLELVRGKVWFTETGGIVKRRTTLKEGGFPESVAHAAVAMRWIFDRLAPLSGRITRIYLYHWNPGGPADSWDSALLNPDGSARPAYVVVRNRINALRYAGPSRSGTEGWHAELSSSLRGPEAVDERPGHPTPARPSVVTFGPSPCFGGLRRSGAIAAVKKISRPATSIVTANERYPRCSSFVNEPEGLSALSPPVNERSARGRWGPKAWGRTVVKASVVDRPVLELASLAQRLSQAPFIQRTELVAPIEDLGTSAVQVEARIHQHGPNDERYGDGSLGVAIE